MLWAILVDLS